MILTMGSMDPISLLMAKPNDQDDTSFLQKIRMARTEQYAYRAVFPVFGHACRCAVHMHVVGARSLQE